MVQILGQEIEGNNVRTNDIFINPNIMFFDEHDNIEVTLKSLFMKSKRLLKNFPIALF